MQDSNIVYTVKAVGVEEATAKFNQLGATIQKLKFNTDGSVTASGKLTEATNNQTNATNRASKAQGSYIGHIAKTTVLSALVNKLFLELVDVSGQAIQQVDLMNNFPATMKSMGQSTGDASEAMQTLRDYVGQVGGNLGNATSYVTRFTGATHDVKAATAIFVGLNNALIAGDSSMEEQRQATIQFAQALERGKPDLREWRTLTQNMSFQLNQVAKAMGFVNANALGEALTSGEASMADFTTKLTELSTGSGDIAKQALVRMQGTQFAFNVLKNTMVQGLAAIINAFNRQNIVGFFSFLTEVIQVLSSAVVRLIGLFFSLVNAISHLFGGGDILKLGTDTQGVADSIGEGAGNADDLADGLGGAKKNAKELSKSLASFDKMNVLPDKTSGSDKADSGGGGGGAFDEGQLGKLGDLFDGIGGKLKEASVWAKIFAGILGGIAALKIGQGLANQFNGFIKTIDETKKNLGRLKDAFKGVEKEGDKTGKSLGEKLAGGVGKGFGGASTLVTSFIGGIAGAIGATLGPAISTALGAIATALGVSVAAAAAIVVAVVAVIVGAVWLIWTNWDTITSFIKTSWNALLEFFNPAIQFFKELFEGIKGAILTVWGTLFGALSGQFEKLQTAWNSATDAIEKTWNTVTDNLGKAWDKFFEKIRPLIETIQGLFKTIKEKVAPVIDEIKEKLGQIVEAIQPVIDKVREFYNDHIKPLIDGIKAWFTENEVLKTALNVLGVILGVAILAPIALVVIAIGLVVALFIALAFAILWVVTKLIEFGTYILGGGLWEDIMSAVTAVGEWFKKKFQEAIDKIKEIWVTVSTWFKDNVWNKIVEVFSAVGEWFREKFQTAWNNITNIFTVVGTWFKDRFQIARDNITKVFTTIWTWFRDNVWNKITGVFSGTGTWFKNTFQTAWNNITKIFSGLWTWFRDNVWNKITGVFGKIGKSIGDAVSGAFKGVVNTAITFVANLINGVITGINTAIGVINKIPGVEISKVTEVSLPQLARGGVINQPTAAILGEDGSEAVVPLENNTEWIDKLVDKINGRGGGQPVQLTVQIGEETIVSKVIDLINEKTQMSGRNTILV